MCIQKKKYFFGNTLCEIIHVWICPNTRARLRHKNALKTAHFLLSPPHVVLLQQYHGFYSAPLCLDISCFSATWRPGGAPRFPYTAPHTAPRDSHAALRRRPVRGKQPGARSQEAPRTRPGASAGNNPGTRRRRLALFPSSCQFVKFAVSDRFCRLVKGCAAK